MTLHVAGAGAVVGDVARDSVFAAEKSLCREFGTVDGPFLATGWRQA